jgi:hypothetical protein
VRLLTIHAAKGLEFKVVVVADAGREKAGPDASDEFLAFSAATREAEKAAEDEERLRLYYVAMTRAIDRLIVSGAVGEGRETPIRWILSRLGCEQELHEAAEPVELERDGAAFLLRVDRNAEGPVSDTLVSDTEVAAGDQLALFGDLGPAPAALGYRLPELVEVPQPPLHRVRRLSYSALALYERCSYRYYAERLGGLRERRGTVVGDDVGGLAATEIGDAVHRLLELPDPEVGLVRAWYPFVTEDELTRIGDLVDAYRGSELGHRLGEAARPELPFAFEHDGVLLHGRFDIFERVGARAVVVDYKTNVLGDRDPGEVVESEYRLQRLVYALACFRAGADEVEVVYSFLEQPDAPVTTLFGRDDVAELEAELSAAIGRIDAGEFVPTPSDFACMDCPALNVVCAGPRLRGGGEMLSREAVVGAS